MIDHFDLTAIDRETVMNARLADPLIVRCTICGSKPQILCYGNGPMRNPHPERCHDAIIEMTVQALAVARDEGWHAGADASATAEREIAELRATLAAERCEKAGALSGWRWNNECRMAGGAVTKERWERLDGRAKVERFTNSSWVWHITFDTKVHETSTAREAMRSADAALDALAGYNKVKP